MKYTKVFITYAVRWKDPHGVARRFRRLGYEAHVKNGRVTIVNEGEYKDAMLEIQRTMPRVDIGAVAVDWGVCEE